MELNTESWSTADHIVLAVSTGIDSMVLLHALTTTFADSYKQLTCLHVNHDIREASTDEMHFIQRYCEQHHINLFTTTLDLSTLMAQGKSIEHEARTLRYSWFDAQMHQLGADVLLTAHHQDDQIETIFYRLMTGKSTRSGLGMASVSYRNGYKIARPLLEVTKADIKAVQKKYEIPFFEDVTNHDNKYVRNDIRNRILPTIEENTHLSTQHLLKLKTWHDEQREILHKQARSFVAEHGNYSTTKLTLAREPFNNLQYSLKVSVLDNVLNDMDALFGFAEKTYIEWFRQLASSVAQATLFSTDKWIIHIAYDKFIIMAKDNQILRTMQISQEGHYRFGHYQIHIHETLPSEEYPLKIRTRKPGDRYQLSGKQGHKKVNRLFIDRKVVDAERDQTPIVINAQNEIIAVGTLYKAEYIQNSILIKFMGDERDNA
ncbi:tRNA lysidine(34) synthetase TilS [Staphylococcus arlettae]|uniref:tRNA lysidine(34) synthetase TilS n=1 Tax=Staphylococcus arlettae TaxID=29378 RepID=UPI000E68603C|nr:tRNA lysidine(34) synthetase TilS [Staphylococcus arlettae]RIM69828.1 tRNA lysidine(34) synthetase TilS [Staphylococcus arlettae]